MITNQSCVGKGLITPAQLDSIHDHLQDLLLQEHPDARIDQIYSCTSFHHDPNVDSGNVNNVKDDPRRKPQPGMIYEAMADFGITATTSTKDCCCWVGDTATDLQAATSAGIQHRYLVATGYGQGLLRGLAPPLPPCPPIWMESLDIPEMDPSLIIATTAATTTTTTALATTLPFYYCQNLAHAVDWILEPHLV